MSHQTLYKQFLSKQLQQKQAEQEELARIRELTNQPKINLNSTSILLKRTIEILDQFPDEEMINLQTSIVVLRAVGILQLVNSVVEAKMQLQSNGMAVEGRLRAEVEFLYYLWEMIDEEEVQCREIKEIIQVLQVRNRNELRQILPQMYTNQQKTQNLIRCWTLLSANQQYYKHMHKSQKSSTSNKQNQSQIPQKSNIKNAQTCLDQSRQLGSPISQQNKNNLQNSHKYIPNTTNKYLTQTQTQIQNKYSLQGGNFSYLDGRGDQQQLQPREFLFTCQMSSSQERELVQRLYRNDIYKTREEMKKERDQQKEEEELKMCTFKPQLMKRPKSVSTRNQIRGYEKAIHRLKAGVQKSKQTQHLREYKPIGQNYQKIKQKGLNPPKFLQRKKKQEQKVLFIISFDLGRHKTNVKIRQTDTQDTVAQRICKIYSLKRQFYQEIREIVRKQLEIYYEEAGMQFVDGDRQERENYEEEEEGQGYGQGDGCYREYQYQG